MFFSTRNRNEKVVASKAILQGLCDDGGLFLPERIEVLPIDKNLLSLSYKEIAFKILRLYLDDFTDEEIGEDIDKAYDKDHFEEKIMDVRSFQGFSFMELFHGNTLTFKDMALSLLPYLMETAKKKHPEKKSIKILTATSGDTGSAVLSSFSKVKDIQVNILYPDFGVAPIQEKQMLYFTNDHARAYALKDSNFDTCQSLIKELLLEEEKNGFTSANSINIGRLLPQIIYYYYTYITLVNNGVIKLGDKIDFIVPTGNFGDIFAGYLAKKMSLPISRLVVSSNKNRILTDFFKTGVYDLHRKFEKTNSPSMDILISSNLERLLYLSINDDKTVKDLMDQLKTNLSFSVDRKTLAILKEDFSAYCSSQKETEESIVSCYNEHDYLLDPHSAVGYNAYKQFIKDYPENHKVLVLTASPLKFPATICDAFKMSYSDDLDALNQILTTMNIVLPNSLKKVLDCQTPKIELFPNEIKKEIFSGHTYLIKTPATTANLGPGFDFLGLALNIFNEFSFKKNNVMKEEGFPDLNGDKNLVLYSYEYVFRKLGLEPTPVLIRQLKNDIPVSRGLGSSSSCILAGILGANQILNQKLSLEEILKTAIEIEGHPDNVAPCLLGGLILNIKKEKEYQTHSLEISPDLSFLLVIPNEKVQTNKARAILPENYSLEDLTFNSSRASLLVVALKTGDISLLKESLEDRVHVPYRRKLIKEYDQVESLASSYNFPMTISGSGSSMLIIYHKNDYKKAEDFKKQLLSLNIDGLMIKKAETYLKGSNVTKEDR